MDDLPTSNPNSSTETPPQPINTQNSTSPKRKFSFRNLSLAQKVGLFGGVFLILLIILMAVLALATPKDKDNSIPETNPEEEISQAKQQETEREQKEASSSSPINQLQKAYTDVIGSDSVKKTLSIDSSGVVTLEYTVPSSDGQVVIKTSYENFADLANKIFNIPTVTRLNVTTYANKFTDKFGQPDQPALKLQVTKATSSKINWPLKKFSYVDYQTILDFHELNSLLQKDYETLTKTKKTT